MAGITHHPPLGWNIKSLLSGLRWRIRLYIWLEGMALALVWVMATFLVTVCIDQLPRWFGLDDFSRVTRGIMLGIVALVLAAIVYRWILRRTFVPLADHSLAVVLERRFGGFRDSLVTAVELNERPGHAIHFNGDMLNHTYREAMSKVSSVSLGSVLNLWPLIVYGSVVMFLTLSIASFAFIAPEGFARGASRFYLLSNKTWPRNATIEVVGVEIQRPPTSPGALPTKELLKFKNQRVKVVKGASATLVVRADVRSKVIPRICTVEYSTGQGDRGKVDEGDEDRIADGYQKYSFDGVPFKHMLSTVEFDIIGRNPPFFVSRDHMGPADRGFGMWAVSNREKGYIIEIVENPIVVETKLDCVFPEYMVDRQLSSWLPRTVALTSSTRLPQGTQITFRMRASKRLKHVYVYHTETGEPLDAVIASENGGTDFQFAVPSLQGSLSLDVTLHDMDDIISETPHRVFVASVEDQAPRIDVVLSGVSTAITPDVRIPLIGAIDDDYALDKTWIEVQLSSSDARQYQFTLGVGGNVAAAVDFREIRNDDKNGYTLKLKDKIILGVKATDKFHLDGNGPHVGDGDQYQLEVVTPDQLLAMLESREAELRARFEIIIQEVEELRDSLLRVKPTTTENPSAGNEPDDDRKPLESPAIDRASALQSAQSSNVYTVQQAQLTSSKSAQEVLGVAIAFRDIREEMINNRIDTEDHKNRLKNEVADPLDHVGYEMFPELDRQLKALEEAISGDKPHFQGVDSTVAQADEILLELDKVLQKLIKFETYNELIGIVRMLIEDQEQLIEKTTELRKKQALEDLQN